MRAAVPHAAHAPSLAPPLARRCAPLRLHLRRARAAAMASGAHTGGGGGGAAAPSVLVVGEALWDGLPSGLFLGGAPCNVGVHTAQLGRSVAVATRVGRDQLGEEILSRLASRGVDTALIQYDDAHRTGFVRVVMKGSEPMYDIVRPSAWDFLEPCAALTAAAASADAIVFGSLAQREDASRAAIRALTAAAKRAVFDVNLRPPFIMRDVVEASAQSCWLLKLNEGEAHTLAEWFDLPGSGAAGALARELSARFGCHVVVTCGGDGAALWLRDVGLFTHAGCKVNAVDAVGAGDAFLASLLDGLLKEEARFWPACAPLARACWLRLCAHARACRQR
jgi:fructokinase